MSTITLHDSSPNHRDHTSVFIDWLLVLFPDVSLEDLVDGKIRHVAEKLALIIFHLEPPGTAENVRYLTLLRTTVRNDTNTKVTLLYHKADSTDVLFSTTLEPGRTFITLEELGAEIDKLLDRWWMPRAEWRWLRMLWTALSFVYTALVGPLILAIIIHYVYHMYSRPFYTALAFEDDVVGLP